MVELRDISCTGLVRAGVCVWAALVLGCGGGSKVVVDSGPDTTNTDANNTDARPANMCTWGDQAHTGEGTYYAADGSGNCSFWATADDLLVAAMNEVEYASSAVCGACVAIDGPNGSVTVRIVDRCPGCAVGDIDMSPQAFENIAPIEAGRVAISWRYVACEPTGSIVYHFKEGSNEWWTAVQVRNHRYPIAKFEYKAQDGSYREVARESYNYFVEANGMGSGPYTFRVTDVMGHVLEDSGIPFVENSEVPGADQFPVCM